MQEVNGLGVFDFLKKFKGQYVFSGNLGKPVWSTQKDKDFIIEGYNRVVWVYSCVGAISSAVSSVPWLLYRKGRAGRLIEIDEHPILTLLNVKANPHMSSKDFLDYWCTYLSTEGKFYAEYNSVNAPTQMYPLYPHYMNPIPNQKDFISGFEYNMDKIIRFAPEEVLWSKFNDPLDVYQGFSPIRALARTIDTENEAVDWNKSTLQNSGIPAGVFSIQNPSPELNRKLEEEWQRRYGGGANARKPLILNSDKATYQPLGLSPMDMDFLNQRKVNRTEICSAFGVPSQIVGDPEGQTYSNFSEAQKAFWENTVIAKYLDHIKEKLEQDLLPRYSDNLVLKYDLSGVGALKENEDKKATRIRELWKSGLIKRNEARYELDFEDDPISGNVYFNELQMSSEPVISEEVETGKPQQVIPNNEEIENEIVEEQEQEDEDVLLVLKKKEPTNFPLAGEDKEVSLRNSNFDLFPIDYAESLQNDYPDIWDEGGNIQGNDTFRVLKRILNENKTADELTDNDKEIIKMRETWSARHFRDFQLAGVIAQVKWLMIGSRGLDHMKQVIETAKDKDKKSLDMTIDEQKAYWKALDNEREKYVQRSKRNLQEHFREEKNKMIRAITNSSESELLQSMNRVIDGDKNKLSRILTADYVSTIDHFGNKTFNELSTAKMMFKAFDPYTDELKKWIADNVGNAVVLVSDTTKREIRKIIETGLFAGQAIGDEDTEDTIAYNIGKLYLDQIIPNRSETIARTETMTAANEGSLSAAKQSGAKVLKYWIPTFDGDTRDTHLEMQNHPAIPLDELFDVGQSKGSAPASPSLSAKERINCRCAIGYKRERGD